MIKCLAVILSAAVFSITWNPVVADMPKFVKPEAKWSGKLTDESLRQLAPEKGFIAEREAWEKLWKAWRPDERAPEIDFDESIVLVGTVKGPNSVFPMLSLDEQGRLIARYGGTLIGGPGFGYVLAQVSREGVESVGRHSLEEEANQPEGDYIRVEVRGTLRTGLVAIGGETTGTTITAGDITWELDFGNRQRLASLAERFDRQRVLVRGLLERRETPERGQRWIVQVRSLKPVEQGQEGTGAEGRDLQ